MLLVLATIVLLFYVGSQIAPDRLQALAARRNASPVQLQGRAPVEGGMDDDNRVAQDVHAGSARAEPHVEPLPEAGVALPGAPAPPRGPGDQQRRRRQRGVIAGVLAIVLIAVGVWGLTHGTSPSVGTAPGGTSGAAPGASGGPAPTPIALAGPFLPTPGPTLIARAVLAAHTGLNAPREAVFLPSGDIAVADTGNRRVVLLGRRGRIIKSIRTARGPLIEPDALAVSGHSLYVLDAKRAEIDRYSLQGHFKGVVAHNLNLDAPGLAVDTHGTLYVANARASSLDVLAPGGRLLHHFTGTPGASGPDQYNQPTDVAVSRSGTIYIVDNANNRIIVVAPSGQFLAQRPIPTSLTSYSVHVLVLPDGRIVASDPSGALLVYPPRQGEPTRLPVVVRGEEPSQASPLDLSRRRDGTILITDGANNRLLLVSLPH